MSIPTSIDSTSGIVILQLLDSAHGRAVKTWEFENCTQIAIGRGADCQVEISDPYVSRNHAELRWIDGSWVLIGLGRHGVLVENELITERPISQEKLFRLGPDGPALRFQPAGAVQKNLQTLQFDATQIQIFQLDEQKLQQAVREIESSDYFQKLREQARRLRQKRTTD